MDGPLLYDIIKLMYDKSKLHLFTEIDMLCLNYTFTHLKFNICCQMQQHYVERHGSTSRHVCVKCVRRPCV